MNNALNTPSPLAKMASVATIVAALVYVVLSSAAASAAIKTKEIHYTVDGESFTGFIAYDNKVKGERPGILVAHEWWGHNDYARKRAIKLAKLGYTAFALDIFGSNKLADHPEDAKGFVMESLSKSGAIRARFVKAMSILQAHKSVDAERIGAMGYCFGGHVVLSMAREGLELDAVASFHGSLNTETPATADAIKGRVMVFNGAADPFVPREQVKAFKQEMIAANANFEVIDYEGVKHSFTVPGASKIGEKFNLPLVYDEYADNDSWKKTLALFEEAFK